MADLLYGWIFLDLFRLAPVIAVLLVAAYKDIKTREVSNKLWLYTPIGLTLTVSEYVLFAPALLPLALVSMVITVGVALGLFYVNKGWGGADTKALIMLAVSVPLAPMYIGFLPAFPLLILWIACIVSLVTMLFKRKRSLPFIPCLLIGFLISAIL
jgi:Flp pilus assembly protein protease CpaA